MNCFKACSCQSRLANGFQVTKQKILQLSLGDTSCLGTALKRISKESLGGESVTSLPDIDCYADILVVELTPTNLASMDLIAVNRERNGVSF